MDLRNFEHYLRQLIREAVSEEIEARRPFVWADSGYLSLCDEGYDTVLGYMATYYPHSLDEMDDPITDTNGLGRACAAACRAQGLEVKKVAAPLILREHHIEVCNSYPISVLASVVPAHL